MNVNRCFCQWGRQRRGGSEQEKLPSANQEDLRPGIQGCERHTPVRIGTNMPAPVADITNRSRSRSKPVESRFFSGHHPLQLPPLSAV